MMSGKTTKSELEDIIEEAYCDNMMDFDPRGFAKYIEPSAYVFAESEFEKIKQAFSERTSEAHGEVSPLNTLVIPTAPGLYWFKPNSWDQDSKRYLIVQVAKTKGGELFGEVSTSVDRYYSYKAVEDYNGKWYGPLPEPKAQ